MKKWKGVLAAVVYLLLAACAPEPLKSMSAAEDASNLKAVEEVAAVILTEENDGETITLKVGQAVHLLLTGNPTTGYMWEVQEVDEAVLHMADVPEYDASSDALGSGGAFDFLFTATAPGETELTLIYYRSFEKDVPPKRTFSVNVVIAE